VANDLVHTGTDTLGKLGIVQRRRVRIPLDALLMTDPVELVSRDAGSDMGGYNVEDLAG
jgi:hypothetical protein